VDQPGTVGLGGVAGGRGDLNQVEVELLLEVEDGAGQTIGRLVNVREVPPQGDWYTVYRFAADGGVDTFALVHSVGLLRPMTNDQRPTTNDE
jgi:hypothetical protein